MTTRTRRRRDCVSESRGDDVHRKKCISLDNVLTLTNKRVDAKTIAFTFASMSIGTETEYIRMLFGCLCVENFDRHFKSYRSRATLTVDVVSVDVTGGLFTAADPFFDYVRYVISSTVRHNLRQKIELVRVGDGCRDPVYRIVGTSIVARSMCWN